MNPIVKIVLFFLLISKSLFAGTINVAVSTNMSYSISELVKEFHHKYPKIKVNITLGSSGKLTAQIQNGAPFGIFMSANMKYPNRLFSDGLTLSKPLIYAKGYLAILSPNQRSFKHGIKLLNSMLVKRIALANPKTAPYGVATFEALENAKIKENIKNKIIYAESISQTVAYTTMAADVGIVAKSSLYSPKMRKYHKGVHWVEVDKKLYTPISQGIVMIKNSSSHKDDLKAFYDFMTSKKAKSILKKYGYEVK